MTATHIRDITDTCAATGPNLATVEPSHIHVPRPSRVRQATVTHPDERARGPVQLEPALEEAA